MEGVESGRGSPMSLVGACWIKSFDLKKKICLLPKLECMFYSGLRDKKVAVPP